MKKTQVLIVGAGPTGLMMACQLARFDIPFRIIEKNEGPSYRSKALAVQARTLEIYDQMGIAEKATTQGVVAEAVTPLANGKKVASIEFSNIGEGLSPFPYILMLEQSKNEQLLLEFLEERSIKVEYGITLTKLQEEVDFLEATLLDKKGKEECLYANWLIGADGASSNVRHSMDLKFGGGTYERTFVLADVNIKWEGKEYGHNQLFLHLFEDNIIAFFPMKGDAHYRVVTTLPANASIENFDYEASKKYLESNGYVAFSMHDCKWFSLFKVHHRCVTSFRKGRCFLAGDSAHVHSPAGGQGMNTGLQDAYNLAWKLAWVIRGKAKESLLDSYNEERLPFAKGLIRTTDRAFNLAVSNNPVVKFLKIKIFPQLLKLLIDNLRTRRVLFKTISQIGINYRGMSLSVARNAGKGGIKPGDRLPFCKVKLGEVADPIFNLLKFEGFAFLIFEKEPSNQSERITKFCAQATINYGIKFKSFSIPYFENEEVYKIYKVKESVIYIVRPDIYVGYKTKRFEEKAVEKYLEESLKLQKQ